MRYAQNQLNEIQNQLNDFWSAREDLERFLIIFTLFSLIIFFLFKVIFYPIFYNEKNAYYNSVRLESDLSSLKDYARLSSGNSLNFAVFTDINDALSNVVKVSSRFNVSLKSSKISGKDINLVIDNVVFVDLMFYLDYLTSFYNLEINNLSVTKTENGYVNVKKISIGLSK